ncbi:unnamed protein product [Orchesella dallaii]|uniref:RRM domain-containing protein n=1 Tax=Orchesella dallaii TaxID=48710 RepID=A0ABP1PT54_9HEXA
MYSGNLVPFPLENGNNEIRSPRIPPEIQEFADRNNFSVNQTNGQRTSLSKMTYFHPDGSVYVPPRGCEVFLGKIPRDSNETELLPILQELAPVYKFRLMMDFSGTNRGYAFAQFYNQEAAIMVAQQLDSYEIRPEIPMLAMISVENCRLLLIGVPQYKSAKEVFHELLSYSPGLIYVTVEKNKDLPLFCPKNRGFACLVYEDHHSAALARSKMLSQRIRLWGYQVQVDWAEPIPSRYCWEEILCVRNIHHKTSLETLKGIFNAASRNGVYKIVRKKRGNKAYIYFKSRDQADMAKVVNHQTTVDGNKIRVDWFNPKDRPTSSDRGTPLVCISNKFSVPESTRRPLMLMPDPNQPGYWAYMPCHDPDCYLNLVGSC